MKKYPIKSGLQTGARIAGNGAAPVLIWLLLCCPSGLAEQRISADSIAYQVERQIRDLGDRVPLNEKARAEQLIAEIRTMVKSNSPDMGRLRRARKSAEPAMPSPAAVMT